MKKIIISLFFVFAATISFAQTQSSDHLTFKGVPIDGKLSEYVSKMKQNGFTHISTENGVAILSGAFAGYEDCIIYILSQNNLVYAVGVRFSDKDNWFTLSTNYFSLKEMLTEKYEEPSIVEEKFDSDSEPRDDGSKMNEVRMDRCKYSATYFIEQGQIILSIKNIGVSHCYVQLVYTDIINKKIVDKGARNDL